MAKHRYLMAKYTSHRCLFSVPCTSVHWTKDWREKSKSFEMVVLMTSSFYYQMSTGPQDTQHNDIQHNDIQNNTLSITIDTQAHRRTRAFHPNTDGQKIFMPFLMLFPSLHNDTKPGNEHFKNCEIQPNAGHCYAECLLCSLSFILSVTYKPFM